MNDKMRGMDQPAARGLSLFGEPLPEYHEPVRTPVGGTPRRRENSVRRTMSIDAYWPDGVEKPAVFLGRARDIWTGAPDAEPKEIASVALETEMASREILAIRAEPDPGGLERLIGVRAGSAMRKQIAESFPGAKEKGAPLYLLLDDLAGASLVTPWAASLWFGDRRSGRNHSPPFVQGVCIGFRPHSSALNPDGTAADGENSCLVGPLGNSDDPGGWHDLPSLPGANFRRVRRIDIWREGGGIQVESHFQDSTSSPGERKRRAVHEYLLRARIGAGGILEAIDAVPGTLPYASCRAAPVNLQVLVGTPVRELRETVLEALRQTAGCTHLNDMSRSLAEVPVLAEALKELQ